MVEFDRVVRSFAGALQWIFGHLSVHDHDGGDAGGESIEDAKWPPGRKRAGLVGIDGMAVGCAVCWPNRAEAPVWGLGLG